MPPEDQNKISLQTAEQYKLLYTISNNIEVYEEPVRRAKTIPYCAVKFETGVPQGTPPKKGGGSSFTVTKLPHCLEPKGERPLPLLHSP